MPRAEQQTGLERLAKRFEEPVGELRDDFTLYTGYDEEESKPSVEDWPEPVDTRELLNDIMKQLRRYVVVSDDIAIAAVLWAMFAWVHDIALNSPVLILTAPDQDSGKTTLGDVVLLMTPRPYATVEISSASFFRTIDQQRPTMFLDENDDLMRRKKEIVHLVNAGWTKGKKVPRTIAGVTYDFELFAPKVLGMIGLNLPPTTLSRRIACRMVPRLPEEVIEEFKQADDDCFKTLRLRSSRWAADNMAALKEAKPNMPEGFINRLAANWRLLFAIADLAKIGKRARAAAIRLSKRGAPDLRSERKRLLDAFYTLWSGTNQEKLTSEEVVTLLTDDEDSEWAEFRGRSPITKRQIAVLLWDYGINPGVVHPQRGSTRTVRGYEREQFTEAFRRWLGKNPPQAKSRPSKTSKTSKKAPKNGRK